MAKNNLRALKNAKTSKAVKEELALSFNLGHRFENEMTVDNMSLIDCYVLQGVLFVLSHRSSNFIEGTANTTINMFNKKTYISGNRCEKGAGIISDNLNLPNLIKYKYERLFNYTPLSEENALEVQLVFLEF